MVIYRNLDGKPGFEQTDSLDQAIHYVEQLRNDDGVESARIYRLEQVEFSFEPFYRVRVGDAGPTSTRPTSFGSGDVPRATTGATGGFGAAGSAGAAGGLGAGGGSAADAGSVGGFGSSRELPPRPEPMASETVSSARPPEPPTSGIGTSPTGAVGDTARVVEEEASEIGPDGDRVRRGLFGR